MTNNDLTALELEIARLTTLRHHRARRARLVRQAMAIRNGM